MEGDKNCGRQVHLTFQKKDGHASNVAFVQMLATVYGTCVDCQSFEAAADGNTMKAVMPSASADEQLKGYWFVLSSRLLVEPFRKLTSCVGARSSRSLGPRSNLKVYDCRGLEVFGRPISSNSIITLVSFLCIVLRRRAFLVHAIRHGSMLVTNASRTSATDTIDEASLYLMPHDAI